MLAGAMNPLDLTANQLKRAAALKERIETLNRELRGILVDSANPQAAANKTGTMSAAVKKKIAATQKARWARFEVRNRRPFQADARLKRPYSVGLPERSYRRN